MTNTQPSLPSKISEKLSNPESSGLRLKMLRFMMGVSHHEIQELSNIQASTLAGWETDTCNSSLDANAAQKITSGVYKAGIFCTPGWLLSGVGSPPEVFEIRFV